MCSEIDNEAELRMSVFIMTMKAAGIPTDRIPDAVSFRVKWADIFIRPMTAHDRMKMYYWGVTNGVPNGVARGDRCAAVLYCLSVCDERGRLLHDLDDVDNVVLTHDLETLVAVALEAARISKLTV